MKSAKRKGASEETKNFLSERLRTLRKIRGLSAEKVAKKLGLGVATLGKWERGEGVPSAENLKTIAEFYDVSIDYLLGRTDYPKVVKTLTLGDRTFWVPRVIPLDEEGENTLHLFGRLASGEDFERAIEGINLAYQDGLRLLKRCLDNEFVQIEVNELDYNKKLAETLCQEFGLREVIVPEVSRLPKKLAFLLIGEVAAHFFASRIRPGQKIALSGGTTIRQMVMSLKHYKGMPNLSGLKLYPLDVCPLPEMISVHSNTLVGILQYFLEENEVEAYGILNPGFLPSGGSFWPPADPDARRILQGARNANAVFVGIGALAMLGETTLRTRIEAEGFNIYEVERDLGETEEGYLITKKPLNQLDKEDIKKEELAVGDILFHLLNIKGEELDHEFNKRIPSIPLQALKNLADRPEVLVVGVAMGEEKATAVYAVLKGRYINTLIVDDGLARAVREVRSRVEGHPRGRA